MYRCLSMCSLAILLLFPNLLACELKEQELSALEFLESYKSALESEDKLRVERLVKQDKERAGIALEYMFVQGHKAYLAADYEASLDSLVICRGISQGLEDERKEWKALSSIGGVLRQSKLYRQALEHYLGALKVAEHIGYELEAGISLNNIGLTYYRTADYKEALGYYQKALEKVRCVGDKKEEWRILNNIGIVYNRLGCYQEAMKHYSDAINVARNAKDNLGNGLILNNMGLTYLRNGDYQLSWRCFEGALKVATHIRNKELEMRIRGNIGYFYKTRRQWIKAVAHYEKSINILKELRVGTLAVEVRESLLEENIDLYKGIVGPLIQLNRLKDAFTYAEESKARSLLDLFYEASVDVKKGVNPQLIEIEKSQIERLFGAQTVLESEELDEQDRVGILQEYERTMRQLGAIRKEIRATNPILADLEYPPPITVKQVQEEVVGDGEALIEYLQSGDEIYSFIIGKEVFLALVLKVSKSELMDRLRELARSLALSTVPTEDFDPTSAHELYQKLFQPLEKEIAKASQDQPIQKLIIIPDGLLHYVPFEMLITGVGGSAQVHTSRIEYLVDRYAVAYAPSASVLKPEILYHRKPEQYQRDLLALAPFAGNWQIGRPGIPVHVDYADGKLVSGANSLRVQIDNAIRSRFDMQSPLPYSAEEIETIAKYYERVECRIDADKNFLISNSTGNRYLHIATHGYLDPDHPMYSGLSFRGAYFLQTYEIFSMDIDAEMVVLSACNTGLGKLKDGEGLVGMTRAFLYAGASCILVSLWSVHDRATADFMDRFYRNLSEGMGKAEALREAKRWMIKYSYHTDKNGKVTDLHSHPFYWAPFILVGDHR